MTGGGVSVRAFSVENHAFRRGIQRVPPFLCYGPERADLGERAARVISGVR